MGFLACCGPLAGIVVEGPWQTPTQAPLSKKMLAQAERIKLSEVDELIRHGAPHYRDRRNHVRFDYGEFKAWQKRKAANG